MPIWPVCSSATLPHAASGTLQNRTRRVGIAAFQQMFVCGSLILSQGKCGAATKGGLHYVTESDIQISQSQAQGSEVEDQSEPEAQRHRLPAPPQFQIST